MGLSACCSSQSFRSNLLLRCATEFIHLEKSFAFLIFEITALIISQRSISCEINDRDSRIFFNPNGISKTYRRFRSYRRALFVAPHYRTDGIDTLSQLYFFSRDNADHRTIQGLAAIQRSNEKYVAARNHCTTLSPLNESEETRTRF